MAKGTNALQTNVQIAQAKGRIASLQNQICAQQALFLKTQQVNEYVCLLLCLVYLSGCLCLKIII